jgi:hypothetical protein
MNFSGPQGVSQAMPAYDFSGLDLLQPSFASPNAMDTTLAELANSHPNSAAYSQAMPTRHASQAEMAYSPLQYNSKGPFHTRSTGYTFRTGGHELVCVAACGGEP